MAPPGINTVLTIVLIVGMGVYFAWSLIREARRATPDHKWLVRREAMFLGNVLVGIMILVGLLQAWRYGTWQPVWVFAGVSVVMLVGLRIWANK